MSELMEQEREYKYAVFSNWVNGLEGEADGEPSLEDVVVDNSYRYPDWPTPQAAQRMMADRLSAGTYMTTFGISSYGHTVYREFLQENPMDKVLLDPRVFLHGTSLIDVLSEAAHCAMDDEKPELVIPFLKGMIETASGGNFAGQKMRKYLNLAVRSNNYDVLRLYVDFINAQTVKGPEDSKETLKEMAHAVAELPEQTYPIRQVEGIDRFERQVLLEDIGHAWIRKSMPVAEIDWLP